MFSHQLNTKWEKISQCELYNYLNLPRANPRNHKGEAKIHLEIVQNLVGLSILGRLKAIWFHPANEIIPSETGVGFGILLKMMGKIPGVSDLIFGWGGGMRCLEVKGPKGSLSPSQKLFKKWCEEFEIPYKIVRSWKEAEETLKEWGILRD